MGQKWWTKFLLVLGVTLFSVASLYPTVSGMDPEKSKFPLKQKINLGLDLQGGLYLVLGVDFNKVFKELITRQISTVQGNLKEKNLNVKTVGLVEKGAPEDDPRLLVTFDPSMKDAVYAAVKKDEWSLRLTNDQVQGQLEFGLSVQYRQDIRDKTINQSIEVVRNRIDEFGVAEPAIARQGEDRLVVELPGVRDIDRAKELIGRTAKLEFRIVNDKAMDPAKLAALVADLEKSASLTYKEGTDKFSDYVRRLNEAARGRIPEDSEIAFERVKSENLKGAPGDAGFAQRIPYLLFKKVDVSGNELQDAFVSEDQESRTPNVSFSLNPRGAQLFDELTQAHLRERLAIVLDGIVHSAPVIQSRIGGGRGQITLGRGDRQKIVQEAQDLAIVLRAGALPAQLDFLEQRVTGPSLGQDSIRKGAMASLIGSLMVFVFVAFYYRVSGLIAVVSLVLNVLFVLAILVGLEATLTLPGIAGIALTVGIAVDSNVVIYERIREELRSGQKGAEAAVEAGFQKAFRTILDANVTNAAAAVVLLYLGTGPIKGFAVSLLIGIVTTLFTAVFVCRLMFDRYLKSLEGKGPEAFSI
jgi:preprotein translocase subunit SecD